MKFLYTVCILEIRMNIFIATHKGQNRNTH
jgi:hypothetical protein